MNVMRLSIAVVVVFLVLWALAWLAYEVLFAGAFEPFAAVMRPDEEMGGVMPYILIGFLIQVILFCVIFTKGYENKGILEGVRYGLFMGLLLGAVDWTWTLHLPVPLSTGLLAAVVSLVLWIIAGAILAAIYKPAQEQSAAV